MIPADRLQQLIAEKDAEAALQWCQEHGYSEGWALIDGALVVYDLDAPPPWLAAVLAERDEDGYTPSGRAALASSAA